MQRSHHLNWVPASVKVLAVPVHAGGLMNASPYAPSFLLLLSGRANRQPQMVPTWFSLAHIRWDSLAPVPANGPEELTRTVGERLARLRLRPTRHVEFVAPIGGS